MTYEITKSDGTTLVEISDGLIDTATSSITFIGKNVVNYGELQNENMLHILENFAFDSSPVNPLVGQLWFDTATNNLKFYNQDSWKTLASLAYSSSSSAASAQGNLWFDSSSGQLKINNGASFTTIGPEMAAGFNTTRLVSTTLLDTNSVAHPVIECVLDDEIIAIISKDEFNVSNTNAVNGFARVYRGITFKNSSTTDVQLYGSALTTSRATALKEESGTTYLTASVTSLSKTIVQRDSSGNTQVNRLTAGELTNVNGGVISGSWSITNDILPTNNGVPNLGSASFKFGGMFANTISGTNLTASESTLGNVQSENIKLTSVTDAFNTTIDQFDKDGTMAANSDAKFATQKAIKTYIDAAIAAELATRAAADIALGNQISTFGLPVPPGVILYHAGSTAPNGYLICDGSLVGKNQYSALYLALGGVNSPYGQSSVSFNLPDLRGEFIRGFDAGRGIDANRVLASVQSSQNLAHNHGMAGDDQLSFGAGTAGWPGTSRGAIPYDARSVYGGGAQIWNTTSDGETESRPRNVALLPIIKY
jgi:microcystin-dependent protein